MPFERGDDGSDAAVDLRARRELRAPGDAHGDAVRRDLDALALDGGGMVPRPNSPAGANQAPIVVVKVGTSSLL